MTERGSSYPSDRDIRERESQGDIAADEARRKGIKERGFLPQGREGKEEQPLHGKDKAA